MKTRMIVALIMMLTGIVLLALSALLIGSGPVLNWLVLLAVGGLLLIVGFALLIMELLETWLSRGQRALVDGLQAG